MFRDLNLPARYGVFFLGDLTSPRHAPNANDQLRLDEIDALADASSIAEGREPFYRRVGA